MVAAAYLLLYLILPGQHRQRGGFVHEVPTESSVKPATGIVN